MFSLVWLQKALTYDHVFIVSKNAVCCGGAALWESLAGRVAFIFLLWVCSTYVDV